MTGEDELIQSMKMKGETQNGNRGQRRKEATVNVLMLKTSTHQFLPHKSHPFCHHYHHHHVKTGTITRKPSTSIENPDLKKKKKAHQGSKKNRKIHFFFFMYKLVSVFLSSSCCNLISSKSQMDSHGRPNKNDAHMKRGKILRTKTWRDRSLLLHLLTDMEANIKGGEIGKKGSLVCACS